MHFPSFLLSALIAFPMVQGHLLMEDPAIYLENPTDNGPLDAQGSMFPCKYGANIPAKKPSAKTFVPGQASSFKIKGGATHGGGSCQISITYDNPPTKDSVFKVIKSYMGGCPFDSEGNLSGNPTDGSIAPIPVTMPEGLKAGEATFVWTWFNRIGNREMYMNCAPVTIGGSETSDALFDSLPDMFVANAANAPGNTCSTEGAHGKDIVFPNPGADPVIKDNNRFAAACPGFPSVPSNGGNNAPPVPTQAPSSTAAVDTPPAVTTRPVLIQDPVLSSTSVGNSFSDISGPSTTLAVSTTPRATTVATTTRAAAPPTTTAVAPAPTAPGNNNGTGNDFVGAACDPSKAIIICHSDPTIYSQCYDNNIEYGPFAVPPGTVCDSTGQGGFKAIQAVSSRFVRRNLARKHRRSYGHIHHRS